MMWNGVTSTSAEALIATIERILEQETLGSSGRKGHLAYHDLEQSAQDKVQEVLQLIDGWKTFRGVDEVMEELEMNQVEGPAMRARDV